MRVIPAFSPLASLPRSGSRVMSVLRFRFCFRFADLGRRGDGKCSVILGVGPVCPASLNGGGRSKVLLMECCSVALASAKGDGDAGWLSSPPVGFVSIVERWAGPIVVWMLGPF